MKRILLSILVFAGFVLIGQTAWAQGRGCMAACMSTYDPAAELTLTGTLVRVDRIDRPRGPGQGPGIHAVLQAKGDTLTVHLGPAWYLAQQGAPLQAGDAVTVVGSRVTLDGNAVLIARALAHGDSVLVLRDTTGLPAWRGWRRGAVPQ